MFQSWNYCIAGHKTTQSGCIPWMSPLLSLLSLVFYNSFARCAIQVGVVRVIWNHEYYFLVIIWAR